ncbi:MAG TPA: PLP-dependent aspartate aminotransferase family protein [Acidobacteriota bacterium]|nr:PLP-dependent aspartate aminotransferase family protein [Acidobacteriota bacterium]
MSQDYEHIETKLIHSGEPLPHIEGAVVVPIFQSSTYESGGGEARWDDIKYMRLGNTPNHKALQDKLAAIENAEAALVSASGMAAITASLLTCLSCGDHLLVQDNLYGGTFGFVTKDLPQYGVSTDFFDAGDPDSWEAKLKPNTRVIYVETISNPLLKVGALNQVAEFARKHGLVSMIDNTFASPLYFRPIEHGFDISLHSATKYLNGHSDVVAGVVIGSAELVDRIHQKQNRLGGSLDANSCFLMQRGLKTLALRVRQQNENALALAEFLEGHHRIEKVFYPGLPSHPDYERAKKLLEGYGGMVSFVMAAEAGIKTVKNVLNKLQLPIKAPSLGGVESLITIPAESSHRGLSAEELERAGIPETLVRVSVGIEAVEDLIEDFRSALE